MAEKFFWADQIADRIIKEKGKKKIYVCASGITPSGIIHIGNFREIITTELVVRALQDKGKKIRFIYSWDDYDRFRKVPANISPDHEKYIGMPLSEIPSPFGDKKSYAEHFEQEFENSLKKVGVEVEFIRQSIMNKKCKYADLIKIALEKKGIIIKELNKYRKKPLGKDWYPLSVYCEKCGKDSTKILDVKDYKIEYSCECNFKNKIDFRKVGIVKLKWRADWPARWSYEKVDYEPGGIDHSAAGSSYDTSKEIVKKVFDYDVPVYTFYEWVRIKGGREFSSSSGNAISLDDVEKIYEPEILRYLFVGTRPKKGFQISFDNDVIKTYDEYDKLERDYFNGLLNPQEKRIYELSHVKNIPRKKPERTNFKHLITLVQTGKINELNAISKKRAGKVKNWLENYAGGDMKFDVQEKLNFKLTKKQKDSMIMLKESLAVKDFSEDELFNEFYNICQVSKIETKEFFQTAYNIIINKNKGPRLASLILAVGKDKVIKLLEQIE